MHTFFSIFACITVLLCMACGSAGEQVSAQSSSVRLTPDGMAIFRKYCVTCHGADGKLGLNGAKDLTVSILPLEERINVITNGKKVMTPFNEVLTPEEIKAVAEYTQTLTTRK